MRRSNGGGWAYKKFFRQSLRSAKFTHLEDISLMIMIDEQINEVFLKEPKLCRCGNSYRHLSGLPIIPEYCRPIPR
ncbi:hypothetical protein [Paenibacillus sp. GM2FR]|uniref:hypothetical protein n=1 Tax=Paenibacillus sp. GM2FR TaxID=2059268 RepID=UPI001055374E|nr:hypothetical protein [Paenibacillus sp. GM2FR]